LKRKREAEENARRTRTKESAQVGPSNQGIPNALTSPDSASKDLSARPAGPATSSSVNEMDAIGYSGADLLSEAVSFWN